MRRIVGRLAHWRGRLIVVAIVVGGVAVHAALSDTGGPPKPVATVEQSVSTLYYTVTGTDTDSIFASILANGPKDRSNDTATDAVGLTSTDSNYVWKSDGAATCHLTTATITLRLTVTLPRLDTAGLPADLAAKWDNFSASVATHEQHHVDISIAGAQETARLMETLPGNDGGCKTLERDIADLWTKEAAQDAFHASEDERLAPQRKPLQDRVDRDQVRID
jgi:predicted secreted Zn-dependent protease